LPVHAQTGNLRIQVRKVTALKQGIIAKADARDNVGSAKRDLLDFWEKFLRFTIQNQLPNFLKGNLFFGPYFSRVKNVKIELMFLRSLNHLNAKLPLWERSIFYGLIQVFSVKVWASCEAMPMPNTAYKQKTHLDLGPIS